MGKIGQVLVTGIVQAAFLILVAHSILGIALPDKAGKWHADQDPVDSCRQKMDSMGK